MSELNFSIDIDAFARMDIQHRIAFLEAALLFNALPGENQKTAREYIENSKAYISDTKQKKHLVIDGGVNTLASVIKENFPHAIKLKSEIRAREVDSFINSNQVSNDDYISCGGRVDSYRAECHFICFRNLSDAVIAKLHFDGSVLLENLDDINAGNDDDKDDPCEGFDDCDDDQCIGHSKRIAASMTNGIVAKTIILKQAISLPTDE